MATFKLTIVTAEREVFSDDVDSLVAPGIEGQLGILPNHAPLMTQLQPGEMTVRSGSNDNVLAVTGGFLEVLENNDVSMTEEQLDAVMAELKEKMKGKKGWHRRGRW
ncbi:MAG: ATP synthase F1 subunit epsilon [Chloroflexi bacterium]|nr:ATP synthase F1 subunit epsilon [Chloroflexota bacterium]